MTAVWVIVALLALAVIIFIHELGHFLAAKWVGIKVTKFAIGFPPEIKGWQKGETRYSLNWILVGGYVKILGMNPDDEVSDEDFSRSYYGSDYWKRAVVILAGSVAHLLVAFVLFFLLFWPFGYPVQLGTVERVQEKVRLNGEEVVSPASSIDLTKGDRIVAVDGKETPALIDVYEELGSHPGETVTISVERGDRVFTQRVTLAENAEGRGILGIEFDVDAVKTERSNPLGALVDATVEMGKSTVNICKGLVSIFKPENLKQIYMIEPRTSEGPRSVVGLAELTFEAAEYGASFVIYILAQMFLLFAIFNLIPLLPLDGGHLAIIIYEKITGREVDMRKLAPVSWVVVAVLLLLVIPLFVQDCRALL